MTQTHTMNQERPITLREQELLDRGHHLAEKLAQRDRMVKDAKDEARRAREEIDELDDEISEIAAQLRSGFENRKQGDLFVDQALGGGLPKDKAAATLTEIAKWAERHPFTASETAIDTCAQAGCGKRQGDTVHVAPAPQAAHTYAPKADGTCWGCGAAKDDPIHTPPAHAFVGEAETCTACGWQRDTDAHPKAEPAAHEFIADGAVENVCSACGGPRESLVHAAAPARDLNAPHAAELGQQPDGEPKACLFCTRSVDDPIHAPAIAETIDCSRCGKHVSKAEVLYDAGVKPVCETCKRAGIEAGTWPHPFRKGHEKAHRCADCMQREDDAVHVEPPVAAPAEETREVAYTPEEPERQAAAAAPPAQEFDPALDGPDTPAEGGGAGA